MDERIWPERDRSWQAAYLWGVTQPEVPAEAVAARLDELLGAVLEAGVPAEELFGDPAALAADDVAELGTAEEVVRSSFGSGAKQTLLLTSFLLPEKPLREDWSEEQWVRRFRAALISRGLSRQQAAERVRELRAGRVAVDRSAFAEYGHPVAFAQKMTEHAPAAKKRRWVVGGAAEVVVPALLLVFGAASTDMWWWMRLLIGGVGAVWLVLNARSVWGSRPWKAAE